MWRIHILTFFSFCRDNDEYLIWKLKLSCLAPLQFMAPGRALLHFLRCDWLAAGLLRSDWLHDKTGRGFKPRPAEREYLNFVSRAVRLSGCNFLKQCLYTL